MNIRRTRWLGIGLVILLVVFTSACSTQARRVDCDGRLEPINRPAPKVKGSQTREPSALIEKRDR